MTIKLLLPVVLPVAATLAVAFYILSPTPPTALQAAICNFPGCTPPPAIQGWPSLR